MENQTQSYVVVLPSMNEDPEEFVFIEEDDDEIDDLSHWEFVHSSDSESGSDYEFDASSRRSPFQFHTPMVTELVPIQDGQDDREPFHFNIPSPSDPVFIPFSGQIQDCQDDGRGVDLEPTHDGYGEPYIDNQEEDDQEEEDDDGYGYGYDLDDELVPRSLSSKLGRERMRKLGKRAFGKIKNSSKKSPILYAKPGCVHGKHGLGMKHRF